MIAMFEEKRIGGEQRGRHAACLQNPDTILEMVGSQIQDGIVEFSRHLQRPPVRAGSERRIDRCGRGALRRRDRQFDPLRGAVQTDVDEAITVALGLDDPIERRERHSGGSLGALARGGKRLRALPDVFMKILRFDDRVDQRPITRTLTAHAFGRRAEHIGEIAAHMPLVRESRQTSGARQHTEQRHLGQAHRRRAIIDQHDFIARKRELVTAPGGRSIACGYEFDA